MKTIEHELNSEQLEVVNTVNGPILVVAGAGSGKTRVIEYRVLNFVKSGIDPQSILLLTFTKKAAQQMLQRAERHDSRCKFVEGGTFHAFAYRMLKKYSGKIGFDEFFILDEADAEDAINTCLGKTGLLDKEKRFPRKDTLRKVFSMVVNKNMSVDDVLYIEYPNFLKYSFEIDKIRQDYAKYKKSKGYFDYDDLLVYFRELLEKNEDIRNSLSEKYKYIMVDEYQDTNKLQADIVYFLAKNHNNVMVVGDDAQSIYGFRGASHENIIDFPRRFPGTRIIKLQTNYRSHQSILDVANAVLNNMKKKYSKELRSARDKYGNKPNLLFFTNTHSEAQWVAEKINGLNLDGIDLKDQAVLFRYAYISIPLQLELNKRRIPFQVFGGLKFYETAHIKDMLAHFKVLLNHRDDISWARILTLLEGIGPKTSAAIIENINSSDDLPKALKKMSSHIDKKRSYSKPLADLIVMLKFMSEPDSPIQNQFEILLDYYYPILHDKFDDALDRMNDLRVIKKIAFDYGSLSDFLTDFALESPEKSFGQPDKNILTLSTIHSAKGLEWKSVFLIGLVEGVLPVSFALDNDDAIEEEQRLFYVAITRAKEQLYLSAHYEGTMMGPRSGTGQQQFNKVSRFLDYENVLSKLKQDVIYRNM